MNYLGGDATDSSAIPSGVTITVTDASTASGRWVVQPGGCPGGEPCVGFEFTADNEDAVVCVVAVRYAPSDVSQGGDTLSLVGRLDCPGMSKPDCDELAVGIRADNQDIELSPPELTG